MKRSTFIYYSLVGTVAGVFPFLQCKNQEQLINQVLRQPEFLSHICDAKTLREIGRNYHDRFPSLAKEEQLKERLLTGSTSSSKLSTFSHSSIITLLNKKIIADFEFGRTLVLQGWVLSETEAQQCALFSLL